MAASSLETSLAFLVCMASLVVIVATLIGTLALAQLQTLKGQIAALARRVAELEALQLRMLSYPPAPPAAPPIPNEPNPVAGSAAPPCPSAPSTPPSPPHAGAFDRLTHPEAAPRLTGIPPAPASPASAPTQPPVIPARPLPGPAPVPPRRAPFAGGFEGELVIKAFVALAAIALALGAILGLRDALAKGLLTPMLGVGLGILMGVVLLGLSQWRARRNPQIAQALSAAGIAALYATFLAGSNLPSRDAAPLSPLVGFAAAGITTVLAVVLSLQLGPLVAAIGLIGGFITPAIINTGNPQPVPLFGYLFLLEVGLVIVARRRAWALLALGAVLASILWVFTWVCLVQMSTIARDITSDARVLATFVLASAVAVVLTTLPGKGEQGLQSRSPAAHLLTWIALFASLLLTALLLGLAEFTLSDWPFIVALSIGCLVLARVREVYEGLAAVATVVVTVLLIGGGPHAHDPGMATHWICLIAGFGVLFGLGSYVCAWGSPAPVRWLMLSIAAGIAHVLAAYIVLPTAPRPEWWAILPVAVAALFVALTVPIVSRRSTMKTAEPALAALFLGILALLAIAVPMALSDAWLTAVWSLLVPAGVFAGQRLRVPALLVGALIVGLLVGVRLLLNPDVFNYASGPSLFWNPFVYGYGVPILAFIITGWLCRSEPEAYGGVAEALAIACLFIFSGLEVRYGFHRADLTAGDTSATELATYTVTWLGLGWLAVLIARKLRDNVVRIGGWAIVTIALLVSLIGNGLIMNPLWSFWEVGNIVIFNRLLYVYGAPALLALVLAAHQWQRREKEAARLVGMAGIVLAFTLVTLEVRQGFQGTLLNEGWPAQREMWIYSVAWIGFGGVVLAAGLILRGLMLRWTSLAIVMLATAKVFLVDMSQLRDLLRFVSLVGLAIALLAVAYLYQRFVFRRPGAARAEESLAGSAAPSGAASQPGPTGVSL